MDKTDMSNRLDKIQINYILSKNRSGSTLLSNLLNGHPNVISISEENIYWKLKRDYGHYTSFTLREYQKFLDDLFFLFERPRNFSRYLFPSKEELFNRLTSLNEKLDYLQLCKFIYTQALTLNHKGNEIKQIVNKEIHFNHLVNDILLDDKNVKIVYLTRDYRQNIYSVTKNKMAGKANYVYQAKKWALEMGHLSSDKLNNVRVLHVKYSDLILNTESVLERICTFLNLAYDPKHYKNYQDLDQSEIFELIQKNRTLSPEIFNLIKSNHSSTLSSININKINEWETNNVYTQRQLDRINFICKDTAKTLRYECSDKSVGLSLGDRGNIFLAWLGDTVSKKYLLLPVKTKRVLRKLNLFNIFNK